MPGDWSVEEVEATVADYLAMLKLELRDLPFNKKERNRKLQAKLNGRSPGAVEFKHANISAILHEMGLPGIDGYKPRGNYQDMLRAVLMRRVTEDAELAVLLSSNVTSSVSQAPTDFDVDRLIVPAPVRDVERGNTYERPQPGTRVRPAINYLEREARNVSLGAAGEQFVLRLEEERLLRAGRKRLASRIEHVASTRGDGLGYDIVSFDVTGRERLIEVKTTRFGRTTPFFASRNEVAVSDERAEEYHLYRVFKFERDPRVFILPGSLHSTCILDPVEYRASLL